MTSPVMLLLGGAAVLGLALQASGQEDDGGRVGKSESSTLLSALSPVPRGLQVLMIRLTGLPRSKTVMAKRDGFDADLDGRLEFVLKRDTGGTSNGYLEVFESTADNTFTSAHVLDLSTTSPQSSIYPSDAGDPDGDGLTELTVYGRTGNNFYVRSYESTSPGNFPTQLVWQLGGFAWDVGVKIADNDYDGSKELAVAGRGAGSRIAVYESSGNNSYVETGFEAYPEIHSEQAMDVAGDLDDDDRSEILYGGLYPNSAKIVAVESVGDDAYDTIWDIDLLDEGGRMINVEELKYAGDLDGDGRKEFLAGGLRPIAKPSEPFLWVLVVLESISDNEVEAVAWLSSPYGDPESNFSATTADVDGDGKAEIIAGSGDLVRIYRNVGDNAWEEIWLGVGDNLWSIGAGDHDGDGKAEIIFQEAGSTGIYEIDPAFAADEDGDGRVDAIDNCPATGNPGQEDADADGVGNLCDNCVFGPNPAQGPAVFGESIWAVNAHKFGWTFAADIVYVRGDLAAVGSYAVQVTQVLPLATSLTDVTVPAAGQGFYYLVRPDCAVGSWQSTLGAEPARDAALP